MTITLELRPELKARLVAEAAAQGVPVGEIVKSYLFRSSPARHAQQLSAEQVDRLLDEAADLIPHDVPALPDDAMSRERIYTREDEWNR